MCGSCMKHHGTRPRLISHLKHASGVCLDRLMLWRQPLDPDLVEELDAEDEANRQKLFRIGRSPLWAETPCHRVQGPIFRPELALEEFLEGANAEGVAPA